MRRGGRRLRYAVLVTVPAVTAALTMNMASASSSRPRDAFSVPVPATVPAYLYHAPHTATPIKHLVVIFQENVSFDHYFGTYPKAANTDGSPFHAKPGTPSVNGLTPRLLHHNPNLYNPVRLTHSQALTCDQNHDYTAEQQAFDNKRMDKFVQYTSGGPCPAPNYSSPGLVMDYYDGNTVTGLWHYAQNYAMSDNSYSTNFGPSTPGALNLVSGNDGGGYAVDPMTGQRVSDPGAVGSVNSNGVGTIYGDLDPAYDDCSNNSHTSTSPVGVMTGRNVGDLLNAKHVTWGWFEGGFTPTGTSSTGYKVCGATRNNIAGLPQASYSPHHEPFQYYASTANPDHLPPTSVGHIGMTDRASHQYDLSAFFKAMSNGNMPAVSFLKAPRAQDGHAGYSDPLDEQKFLAGTINKIEQSPAWPSTAIVIAYDDSDGWYDHQASTIVNGSKDPTLDTSMCTSVAVVLGMRNDRCGYGPRQPLLVISPYTRTNYVSHTLTDQSSVLRFIEDNWLGGQRLGNGSFDAMAGRLSGPGGLLNFSVEPHFTPVLINPVTGEVVRQHAAARRG